MKKNKISFCAIIKDNITNVKALFKNIFGLCDEIIIVDTGSKQNVIDYEKKHADQVFSIPFKNDFSVLRNFAIKKSSNKWILTLDSDETLTEELKKKIPDLVNNPKNIEGYRFKRINYCDEKNPLHDFWKHLRLYKRNAIFLGTTHESIRNLRKVIDVECRDCYIMHHSIRKKQRIKAMGYSVMLNKKIAEIKKSGDKNLEKYYLHKLWMNDNYNIPETDSKTKQEDLLKMYENYRRRKKQLTPIIKLIENKYDSLS